MPNTDAFRACLAGSVRDFEKDRSFAVVEGGKWVGAARAGFDGVVIAHDEALMRKPELLSADPCGEGWMLIVRPARDSWRSRLVTEPT